MAEHSKSTKRTADELNTLVCAVKKRKSIQHLQQRVELLKEKNQNTNGGHILEVVDDDGKRICRCGAIFSNRKKWKNHKSFFKEKNLLRVSQQKSLQESESQANSETVEVLESQVNAETVEVSLRNSGTVDIPGSQDSNKVQT